MSVAHTESRWSKRAEQVVEMNNAQFLDYCLRMAETPRCGFSAAAMGRLLALAGYKRLATLVAQNPSQIWDHMHDEVRGFVAMARGAEVLDKCQ